MAVQTITYDNKVALNENPDIADVNKVTDDDMNEIKSVVNNNATETSDNTTAVNNLTPIVLYNNENNTSLNIVLNDSSANYSYLEIYVADSARFGFTKVSAPNGKSFGIIIVGAFNSEIQLKCANFSISGTAINSVNQKAITLKNTGNELWTNDVYIKKVVGYK